MGKGDGRGISGFAVNRGAVNRGFTVVSSGILSYLEMLAVLGCLALTLFSSLSSNCYSSSLLLFTSGRGIINCDGIKISS